MDGMKKLIEQLKRHLPINCPKRQCGPDRVKIKHQTVNSGGEIG